jgi:hypothetical protein
MIHQAVCQHLLLMYTKGILLRFLMKMDSESQFKVRVKILTHIMVPLARLFVALIVIGDDVIKGVSQVLFVLLALFEISFLSAFVL